MTRFLMYGLMAMAGFAAFTPAQAAEAPEQGKKEVVFLKSPVSEDAALVKPVKCLGLKEVTVVTDKKSLVETGQKALQAHDPLNQDRPTEVFVKFDMPLMTVCTAKQPTTASQGG